jgi:hypothetical protein
MKLAVTGEGLYEQWALGTGVIFSQYSELQDATGVLLWYQPEKLVEVLLVLDGITDMKICANLPFLNDVIGYRAKRESDPGQSSSNVRSSVVDPVSVVTDPHLTFLTRCLLILPRKRPKLCLITYIFP